MDLNDIIHMKAFSKRLAQHERLMFIGSITVLLLFLILSLALQKLRILIEQMVCCCFGWKIVRMISYFYKML